MKLTSLLRIWLTRSFRPFIFTNKYLNLLDYENTQQLGLYVHIPFCKSICSFCPYCKVVYDESLARKYKTALVKEINLVGSTQKDKKEATSLYFGGGTPALMADDLDQIIQTLKKYFYINGEIGVELHPNDISESLLAKLKSAGVTMISVGIQSFDEGCLSALGRSRADYDEVFHSIKNACFQTVDMDLIFGIPRQTEKTLLKDIETAFAGGATQISTYPFIDFTFANNNDQPLPARKKKKMLKAIASYCEETERVRTSVWTFAEPKTKKYSSITRDNFLGFGVSATTLLKDQFKINTFSIEGYIHRIESQHLPTSLTLDFSLRQRAVYYLFWSAYSMEISPEKFRDLFGISLNRLFGVEFYICRIMGLVKKEEGNYHLTERGAYYYHYIEQVYTTAYIDKMWNISRNIPFPDQIILK
ncbi:MAG: radical SAM protein [Eubacteriales bacterium]|nr:radical SAM protein [Eubacteriales bacterium]